MAAQFKIGLGVAVIFGLLPFAVKDMPQSLTWAGITLGGLLAIWGMLPNHEKIPIAPAIIFIACVSGLVGSLIWGWRDLASTEAQPEKIEQIMKTLH